MRRRIFNSLIWLAAGASLAGLAVGLAAALLAGRYGVGPAPAFAAAAAASLLLGLLAGYAAAGGIAGKIAKEINGIDFEEPHSSESLKELAPLIERIRRRDDLIDRQMAELEKKQNEFRMITENMREGFLIADAEGTLMTYNSSALRLLGAPDNMVKENIAMLCEDGQYKAAVKAALEGVGTSMVLKIDKRYCHIFASPSLVGGRVTGLVMVILDVTEKEQWEELRREFTSNVSHELKTPLTTIRGTAEIMLGGIVRPEDTERFLKSIYDEAGRLLTLIEDILKLSQLDENNIGGEFESVDLYELGRKVTEGLIGAARLGGVSLELKGEPVSVEGVAVVLEEMLFNLVDNAIKYNKPGGRVTVEIFREAGGGRSGRPALRVADTGIGIPKEYTERVFERFFRVDKSRSKAAGGTGLGLSIVKHAAAYHGAEIALESAENEGTTVTIRF